MSEWISHCQPNNLHEGVSETIGEKSMEKRTGKQKIQEYIRTHGCITTGIASRELFINQPFGRISDVRALMPLADIWVKKKGKAKFKLYYSSSEKASAYMQENGLLVAL